jgi:hypothetical protein
MSRTFPVSIPRANAADRAAALGAMGLPTKLSLRRSKMFDAIGRSSVPSTAAFAKQLDKLVREIVGNTKDAIILERARALAQAELDLARVRQAKVALIERASAFGELDPPQLFGTVTQIIRAIHALGRDRISSLPEPINSSATMPSQEPDRSAEAVRRVLPDLRKLDRYEHRAALRRDHAVRALLVESKLVTI